MPVNINELVVGYMVRFKSFGRTLDGQVKKINKLNKVIVVQVEDENYERNIYAMDITEVL